jgi:hypothetical protein
VLKEIFQATTKEKRRESKVKNICKVVEEKCTTNKERVILVVS